MTNSIKINIAYKNATSIQQTFDVVPTGSELNVVAYTGNGNGYENEEKVLEAVMIWASRKWDYIDKLFDNDFDTAVVNDREYDLEECKFVGQ